MRLAPWRNLMMNRPNVQIALETLEFREIRHLPLHPAALGDAPLLHHTVIDVQLPLLPTLAGTDEHANQYRTSGSAKTKGRM